MRIQSIDALRGLAILGILTMNIGYHFNIFTGYVSVDPPPVIDRIIWFIQMIFADGRFRTLFCIIFGVGLAILQERSEIKGLNPALYLKSRLFWLFFIGMFHGIFLFGGDILMMYSIAGYLTIKHLFKTPELVLEAGIRLFIIGSGLCVALATLIVFTSGEDEIVTRSSELFVNKYALITTNYPYFMGANTIVAVTLLALSWICILWQVVGLMLIGIYLYRDNLFLHGLNSKRLNQVILCAVITTLLSVLPYYFDPNLSADSASLFATIPAFFMALLYIHLFVKLASRSNWLIDSLKNCGKIALSLYIFQSLSMMVLFKIILYRSLPEFVHTIDQLDLMTIVVVFTLFQMMFANWVMKHYSQGPLEVLWRHLYLKRYNKKTEP